MPNIECEVCVKKFYKRPGEIKKTKHNFCSKRCFGKFSFGKKHTKEAKQKISKANKGKLGGEKNPMFGIRLVGEKNGNWKGGYKRERYIYRKVKDHPNATKRGSVREHRLVMEESLGRYLTICEVVHHENGDTTDNRLENLTLFENDNKHQEHHRILRRGL